MPLVPKTIEKEATTCEPIDFAEGAAVAFTAPHPGAPDGHNEDAAGLVELPDGTGIIVVADGVGGHPAGREAGDLAVATLFAAVERAIADDRNARDGIIDGFEQANRKVIDLGVGAGSTLVVAHVKPGRLRTYHAGDAAVLVTGQRGKIKLLTTSHSPVGYAIEAGLLGEREAIHHEDRNVVSNFLGSESMHIELGARTRLSKMDTVVVASDGLFDNLQAVEIADRVRTGKIRNAALGLARNARARMEGSGQTVPSKPDDLTFIVYRPRR